MADYVSLITKMEVELSNLKKGMEQAGVIAEAGMKKIQEKFKEANKKINEGFKLPDFRELAEEGIAEIISFEALRRIRELVKQVAELGDEAERLGVSTGFLQNFRTAMEEFGVSSEKADTALDKFARRVSDAASNSGYLYRYLKANNESIRDQNGQLLTVEQALQKVSILFHNTANPVDRLNAAANLFGKEVGPKFVQVMDDLQRSMKEAADTSFPLTPEEIEMAKELNKQFTEMEATLKSWAEKLSVYLGTVVVGALKAVANALHDIFSDTTAAGLDQKMDELFAKSQKLRADIAADDARARQFLPPGVTDLGNPFDLRRQQAQSMEDAANRLLEQRNALFGERGITATLGGGGEGTGGTITPAGSKAAGGAGPPDRSKEVLEDLNNQLAVLQAMGDERTKILFQEKLLQELRRANVGLNTAEGRQIEKTLTEIEELTIREKHLAEFMDNVRSVASAGMNTFINDLVEGKGAVVALNDSLKNILNTLVNIAEQNLLKGLFGESGTFGGGVGGSFLASLFGFGSGTAGGVGFPRRQGGGQVTGGYPYIVGEHGPELMVPNMSGSIVPAGAFPGSGGGGVQINVINNTGSEVQQRKRTEGGRPVIDLIIGEVSKRMGSGDFDSVMRGRYGTRPLKVR